MGILECCEVNCMIGESTGLQIEYTARGTLATIAPKLKQMTETELGRIDKMMLKIVSAHVILTEDKYRQTAEVNLVTAHETLTARCEGTDMAEELHGALRKIEQQAVKHKERKITVERHAKPDSAEPLVELASLPERSAS